MSQLDSELDDITVDKMFHELVKNNPNNKVLEAIQKELESPVRSFLRNTKIGKLIKKRGKHEGDDHHLTGVQQQSSTNPATVPTAHSAPAQPVQTLDQKLLSEALQGLPITTQSPLPALPQAQALTQQSPYAFPQVAQVAPMQQMQMMYPQAPAMMNMPAIYQQQAVHPAAYQMPPASHPHTFPQHHSLQPYSQLPAPDHYLPEESGLMQYLMPAPGQPIMYSQQLATGEFYADQAMMPITVNKLPATSSTSSSSSSSKSSKAKSSKPKAKSKLFKSNKNATEKAK